MEQVIAKPLIATKFQGRTIAGIKDQDEAHMWKDGDELWGQKVKEKKIKIMEGDSAEDLDRFRGDYLSFASTEASEQYDAFWEGNLVDA